MEADTWRLKLERDIQHCNTRLRLLLAFGDRNDAFRTELEQRRADAMRQLAEHQATPARSV